MYKILITDDETPNRSSVLTVDDDKGVFQSIIEELNWSLPDMKTGQSYSILIEKV